MKMKKKRSGRGMASGDLDRSRKKMTPEEDPEFDAFNARLIEEDKEWEASPECKRQWKFQKRIDELQGQYKALFGEELYFGLIDCNFFEKRIELLERCIREGKPCEYPESAFIDP